MGTSVTSKGQVTIPKKVTREHLDIGPGSRRVRGAARRPGLPGKAKDEAQIDETRTQPFRRDPRNGNRPAHHEQIMALTRAED